MLGHEDPVPPTAHGVARPCHAIAARQMLRRTCMQRMEAAEDGRLCAVAWMLRHRGCTKDDILRICGGQETCCFVPNEFLVSFGMSH